MQHVLCNEFYHIKCFHLIDFFFILLKERFVLLCVRCEIISFLLQYISRDIINRQFYSHLIFKKKVNMNTTHMYYTNCNV